MEKIIILLVSTLIILSCSKNIKDSDQSAISVVDTENVQVNNDEMLLKKYKKEGFIDKDTYVVLIVRPSGTKINQLEIENQAKKRAFVSLQNMVKSDNRRLSANDKTVIVNSINDNGKLRKIHDEKQAQDVYVFEINEENFYNKIKQMGI